MEAATEAGAESAMALFKGFSSLSPYIPGRRSFIRYRDLGLETPSNGRVRAVLSASIPGKLEETGWHYHPVEFQFLYFLKGELTIEFEDGTVCTFAEGDAVLIPGGYRHNVIAASDDKELIELTVPADVPTVSCPRPEELPDTLTPVRNTTLGNKTQAA